MDIKIALLIDCDNISFKVIDGVLTDLKSHGQVIIKRAYGNWRNDTLKNWVTKLTELSIKPIHQIDYTKGKNATDMAIVIDAMDLMHLKKVNAFALVTSDSDFTPLTMKLQEEGFKVYGFGNSTTPSSLRNSCSMFTDIQSIQNKISPSESLIDNASMTPDQLSEHVLKIFTQYSPDNEPIILEKFNQYLKENHIDYKKHGFKQFKVFIDDLDIFQITINEKSQGFLKLKVSSKIDKISAFQLKQDEMLKNNFLQAYRDLSVKQPQVLLSTFFNLLSLQHKFTHKNYGYSNFKEMLLEIEMFKFHRINDQDYLSL